MSCDQSASAQSATPEPTLHIVFTGPTSRRMAEGLDQATVDATSLGLADRLVIVAERDGYAASVLSPPGPNATRDSIQRAVHRGQKTAAYRLRRFAAFPAADLLDAVGLILAGLQPGGSGAVITHAPGGRRAPAPAAPSSSPDGSNNDHASIRRLKDQFIADGGRIVDFDTVVSGPPKDCADDAQARRVVIAVLPDGRAGAAVWHLPFNHRQRVRLESQRAKDLLRMHGLGHLSVSHPMHDPKFDRMIHLGTAIRRALKAPFTVPDPAALPEELAMIVLGTEPWRPTVRGGHSSPNVLRRCRTVVGEGGQRRACPRAVF